ncbi:MAG: hypothetical protein ACO2OV_08275 [Thermoproteota archaeon]|jgi:hypothetical protein
MTEKEPTLAELTINPLFAFLTEIIKVVLGTGWATNLNLAVSLYIGDTKLGTIKFEGDAKIHPFEVKKE